jgi:predicted nucleotide-binding protein (sugar kinase/HSP70/actin superfamily)
MIKVGIPQALLYYQYYPMWKTFFERLGAEVVVSSPTNRTILNLGVSRAVADTCLPVKIFLGHVISLINKCDCIFVPAVTSLGRKTYNCSKIIGLPNMTRALIPECPIIFDPEINLGKGRYYLYQNIYNLGRYFTPSPFKIKKAVEDAWKSNLAYQSKIYYEGITLVEAIDRICQGYQESTSAPEHSTNPTNPPLLTVAVIGHPYVIYDDYLNHRLIPRLQSMGVKILFPEVVPGSALDAAARRLAGEPHWSFETDIIGAGEYYLEKKVDGIVNLSVFGCGPDSMMVSFVERRAKELKIPLLHLSLDEHATDGALLTRLEAFLDMIKWKERICV